MDFRLEVGKTYRTKTGKRVRIVNMSDHLLYKSYRGDDGHLYGSNGGRVTAPQPLVEEYVEYRVGDVVTVELNESLAMRLNDSYSLRKRIKDHQPAPDLEHIFEVHIINGIVCVTPIKLPENSGVYASFKVVFDPSTNTPTIETILNQKGDNK